MRYCVWDIRINWDVRKLIVAKNEPKCVGGPKKESYVLECALKKAVSLTKFYAQRSLIHVMVVPWKKHVLVNRRMEMAHIVPTILLLTDVLKHVIIKRILRMKRMRMNLFYAQRKKIKWGVSLKNIVYHEQKMNLVNIVH